MRNNLKVGFGEIPDSGLRLTIDDESWFPDRDISRQGPVQAKILLESRGAERVLLSGEIKVRIGLECGRCLETFSADLDTTFKLDLEYTPESPLPPAEHCCSDSEMDTIFLTEPVINLPELLTQQIFLALPTKKICSEECKGLCPKCGGNLNDKAACQCRQPEKKSPFGVLAGLKVKKK